MKSWGLRFEIVISLVLLVTLAAGLMGIVVFLYTQREMIEAKKRSGLILAKAVENRMSSREPVKGLESIAGIWSQSGFEELVILDRPGRVLAATSRWSQDGRPSRSRLKLAMSSAELQANLVSGGFLSLGEDYTLDLSIPLFKGDLVIGAVGLFSSLTQLKGSWRRIRWFIILSLGLDTLVTVIFGTYLLSRRVLRPLRRMMDRVEALAIGEYQPGETVIENENEIGRLEESFEYMASRLLDTQADLKANILSLEEAQEGLIRSEKLATVGRLGAGLAHELGNPLGSLLGFVHLLGRDDISEEEKGDFLKRMEAEISRMNGIVHSLLDFARPVQASPGPVDVNQTIEKALGLAAVQKCFGSLEVVKNLSPDLPSGRAEINGLTQVFLNLLDNAGQAMDGRGCLTVTTGQRDDKIFISVADTGPGIAAEDLPHILEPFYTTKAPGRGTGLGLSVSLSIIESYGGRLEVEDLAGSGAVFTVLLPAEELS